MNNKEGLENSNQKEDGRFLNLQDLVQVRYEMLRESFTSGKSISKVCAKYNYSRERFYHFKKRFEKKGILGLMDKKGGPKKPYKVNEEIEGIILNKRKSNGKEGKNIYAIAKELKKEGIIEISAKTVERILKKYNLVSNGYGVKNK
ncbi:MAG: helix-turn-helix domain-containing protein [bacterium]|nr:helix-turn-helix domain-containing protein [bacterium]